MTIRSFLRTILPLGILLASLTAARSQQSNQNNAPLTNAAVVKLVKAGFREKSLLTIILSRPANFDLSTDRIIELKKSGVSERIILAMISRQEGTDFSDENWGDEEFRSFGSPGNSSGSSQQGTPSDRGSVDIFGSSGGSRGSTKSRGGNGDSSGETVTTGSATVRILRPPTEGGGAPTKLEKTPSLTNDAVIELVEAGFSEGTIIRRIEQSPVDFDFAPEKLADLKKHRVTDKIVTAMKTAMGVESGSNSTPTSNGAPKN
jgi:hypothetical protein